ncbi:MAG: hypothetical protein ABIV47_17960 [Roseiflexaceae bacterium]
MIAICRGAATADLEAAAELQDSLHGRRAHLDDFVAASVGLFRPELTPAQAAASSGH